MTRASRLTCIDPSLHLTCSTICTCDSGGIQALDVNDENGGWGRLAGAANTNSVRNLDIDKIGAGDSLTGAVMLVVTVVIERIEKAAQDGRKSGQIGCR